MDVVSVPINIYKLSIEVCVNYLIYYISRITNIYILYLKLS